MIYLIRKAKLPMGIENFERIRKDGFYYVDKTGLIRDFLENPAYVNLFTRPRRFGKTLNMSMLKHFFEAGSDRTIFDGLEISGEKERCEEYMGKFPVISITLKGATGENFEEAKVMFRRIIGRQAKRCGSGSCWKVTGLMIQNAVSMRRLLARVKQSHLPCQMIC